jgi:hypothetical protein
MTLTGIGTLDGSQRVAGVDRADEGVGGFNAGDFGDLADVEQGGDAGRRFLPKVVAGARMWL